MPGQIKRRGSYFVRSDREAYDGRFEELQPTAAACRDIEALKCCRENFPNSQTVNSTDHYLNLKHGFLQGLSDVSSSTIKLNAYMTG